MAFALVGGGGRRQDCVVCVGTQLLEVGAIELVRVQMAVVEGRRGGDEGEEERERRGVLLSTRYLNVSTQLTTMQARPNRGWPDS